MGKKLNKKQEEYDQKIAELIYDLQRTRADFENYRKHTAEDLARAKASGQTDIIKKILPILDIIDKATENVPSDIANNEWVNGIVAMQKKLDKTLSDIGMKKLNTKKGDLFDHDYHSAIQFIDKEGDKEVVSDVLRQGYTYKGQVVRHSLVNVTKN